MSKDGGFIKLYRDIAKNELWLSERFSRGQAWADLLLLANWKPGFVRIRGCRVDLKRGQRAASIVEMARRWQWSEGKVRRFLNELETVGQIAQQKNNVTTVVTITNYDTYQENGEQIEEQTASRRRADGEQTETEEEGKERKEGQEGKKKEASCAETSSTPHSEFSFPVDGKSGSEWMLTSEKLVEYQDAFPALDIPQELRAARQWIRDNPTRRKTSTGMLGFLTRWLGKAQNSGKTSKPPKLPNSVTLENGLKVPVGLEEFFIARKEPTDGS